MTNCNKKKDSFLTNDNLLKESNHFKYGFNNEMHLNLERGFVYNQEYFVTQNKKCAEIVDLANNNQSFDNNEKFEIYPKIEHFDSNNQTDIDVDKHHRKIRHVKDVNVQDRTTEPRDNTFGKGNNNICNQKINTDITNLNDLLMVKIPNFGKCSKFNSYQSDNILSKIDDIFFEKPQSDEGLENLAQTTKNSRHSKKILTKINESRVLSKNSKINLEKFETLKSSRNESFNDLNTNYLENVSIQMMEKSKKIPKSSDLPNSDFYERYKTCLTETTIQNSVEKKRKKEDFTFTKDEILKLENLFKQLNIFETSKLLKIEQPLHPNRIKDGTDEIDNLKKESMSFSSSANTKNTNSVSTVINHVDSVSSETFGLSKITKESNYVTSNIKYPGKTMGENDKIKSSKINKTKNNRKDGHFNRPFDYKNKQSKNFSKCSEKKSKNQNFFLDKKQEATKLEKNARVKQILSQNKFSKLGDRTKQLKKTKIENLFNPPIFYDPPKNCNVTFNLTNGRNKNGKFLEHENLIVSNFNFNNELNCIINIKINKQIEETNMKGLELFQCYSRPTTPNFMNQLKKVPLWESSFFLTQVPSKFEKTNEKIQKNQQTIRIYYELIRWAHLTIWSIYDDNSVSYTDSIREEVEKINEDAFNENVKMIRISYLNELSEDILINYNNISNYFQLSKEVLDSSDVSKIADFKNNSDWIEKFIEKSFTQLLNIQNCLLISFTEDYKNLVKIQTLLSIKLLEVR